MKPYSTDDASTKGLEPHGKITFTVIDENIILYRAIGPFNRELSHALEDVESDVLKFISQTKGNWVEVAIFENSCMALDEFFMDFGLYLAEMKKKNLVPLASAFVFPDEIEGPSFMKERYEKAYKNAGIRYSAFNQEEDAISWVRKYIAK